LISWFHDFMISFFILVPVEHSAHPHNASHRPIGPRPLLTGHGLEMPPSPVGGHGQWHQWHQCASDFFGHVAAQGVAAVGGGLDLFRPIGRGHRCVGLVRRRQVYLTGLLLLIYPPYVLFVPYNTSLVMKYRHQISSSNIVIKYRHQISSSNIVNNIVCNKISFAIKYHLPTTSFAIKYHLPTICHQTSFA
jgi:hypothetical protein